MAHGDGKEGYGCYRVTGLVSTGAQLVPCGLWGHCVIISYTMPHTPGCRGVRPCLRPQWPPRPSGYGSQATQDKLPSQHRLLLKAYNLSRALDEERCHSRCALRLPIPSSICLSQPALRPKLPPCKTENNIFLLQLHLLCFSKTGFNQR